MKKILSILIPFMLTTAFFTGCSDMNHSEDSSNDVTAINELESADSEISFLKTNGILITDPASGLFIVEWNKMFRPHEQTTDVIGKTMSVAFGTQQETFPGMRKGGIDIGTVTLNYDGTVLEIPKQTTPDGGIIYNFMKKPERRHHENAQELPPSVPFISNGIYEFKISGSDAFTAVNLPITAPASLITISNFANEDSIASTSDVTFNWTGGNSADKLIIRVDVIPDMPHQGGKGKHHGHENPMPSSDLKQHGPDYVEVIETNSGSYTLTATTIADILSKNTGTKLAVHVEQVSTVDTIHPTGTLKTILKNEDTVVLNLK